MEKKTSVESGYFLNNQDRVSNYFDNGVNSAEKDGCINDRFISGKPFYLCLKGIRSRVDNVTPAIQNYAEDALEFLEIVGGNQIPVQFGDLELSHAYPAGLVFKKARMIGGKGIILKLNKKRHWSGVRNIDDLGWEDKEDHLIWRGAPTGLKTEYGINWSNYPRYSFVERNFKKHDIAFSQVGPQGDGTILPFVRDRVPVSKQLSRKYIVSLEGNDVATNLKWILASNSVPIMPKPTRESWLLESHLIPYVHYVPLSDDLDNLDEVYDWCLNNDDHCQQIAENGKRFMDMFFDEENEKEIYRMIYKRYQEVVG